MKSAYEIVWSLMPDDGYSDNGVKSKATLSQLTGIPLKEIERLSMKYFVFKTIEPWKQHRDVIRVVLDEMEQGKPHYLLNEEVLS